MAATVLSIQGEHLREVGLNSGPVKMDDEDVAEYLEGVGPEVVDCRERGRHDIPTTNEVDVVFTGVTSDGLFIRKLKCKSCGLAQRIELWEGRRVRRGRRMVTQFGLVSSRPDYSLRGPNGERYLAPAGWGRMSAKQVRNAVVSKRMGDADLTALRKQLQQAAD